LKHRRFILCLLFGLAGCAGISGVPDKLALEPVSFSNLPGWNEDRQSEALPAFARSCTVLAKSPKAQEWKPACAALANVPGHDDAAARAFFERYFTAYAASGKEGEEGLFTGYYEPELRGSLHKTKRYHVPLYARPRDLVTVDLGQFKAEWKGKHITGKVEQMKLVPYDHRAAIAGDSLQGLARVIAWVDDPIDAFFLEIQGSGRVRLTDGRIVRLGYDQANGRDYTAIGRVLADVGALSRPVTMQKIRAWLTAHPDRAQEVMDFNASYVFFRRLKGEGPIGAEGVALTPLRSLAVDPTFVKLGIPVWLDTSDAQDAALQRLVIAQDTGGAIKGSVRGDFFWGAGKEAETEAGAMQSKGRYYILLPKDE
jgi:membrane-bound lytic murein transglycosylase A